ncbi:Similar to tRNA1(Val) (adenine(37)-N6)-methyltransferase; acc. no. C6X2D2 [Pyronema omphalodes CBS 100304]|uniref:Similar to tRNA1(Val) (Adenine(37)-N6)-methyltransferase acc. no. C6X2D2 n=1 Tax=Pyronema omphalodes (strain CBS 100304) TaxID=1076935 RepID=U4LE55_PYROM|nr:Similar to tRNA1(Val) (adenine(37)-N6)-methyltransferase; acc. no. C6X2D2 [Pyronema omphalodes CBS 100304]
MDTENTNENDKIEDIEAEEEYQEIDYGDDDPGYHTHDYESSRLDLHHEIFVLLLDGELYKAPLDPSKQTRILDIGTGTGVWAFEMACKFPDAEIIATDLSPVARFPWGALANCRFEVDDVEREWLYQDFQLYSHEKCFHHRLGLSDGPDVSVPFLTTLVPINVNFITSTTQPGGWVEISDLGGVCYSDNGTLAVDQGASTYIETLSDALARAGRPFQTGASLKGHLEKAGFVNIQVFRYKQPWGPWSSQKALKQAGALFLMQADTGFEAYALAPLTRILGMGHEEAMQICKGGIMASKNKNAHVYNYYHLAIGQKPKY